MKGFDVDSLILDRRYEVTSKRATFVGVFRGLGLVHGETGCSFVVGAGITRSVGASVMRGAELIEEAA